MKLQAQRFLAVLQGFLKVEMAERRFMFKFEHEGAGHSNKFKQSQRQVANNDFIIIYIESSIFSRISASIISDDFPPEQSATRGVGDKLF